MRFFATGVKHPGLVYRSRYLSLLDISFDGHHVREPDQVLLK